MVHRSLTNQTQVAKTPSQESKVIAQPEPTKPVEQEGTVSSPVSQESKPTEPVAQQAVYHSDDFYMEYIFQKESGGNPFATNSIGCIGLGQACPSTKLLSVCPNLGDIACQIQFFSNYALTRYGSWAKAYDFWVNNHWW